MSSKRAKGWNGLLGLGLILGLGACTDRGAERSKALEERVARLEAEVRRQGAQLAQLRRVQAASDPARVTDVAAARTCALDLARDLEGYRTDNERYPAAKNVSLPASCNGLQVDWRQLTAKGYTFEVRGAAGRMLTRQSSQ